MEVIVIPAKGSKTGVWYNCEWCGQLKYMNVYHYNNTKHHFCSNECSIAWHHETAYEHRPCEICGKDMYLSKNQLNDFVLISVKTNSKRQESVSIIQNLKEI